MARTSGSNNFAGTLEILASSALDARDIVQTKADLTASGSFPYPYVGMETYVVSENKKYRLIADDPTEIDNWEEVGGGSSLPPGGTQGQVLTKQSSTEGDADWGDIPHDNTKANSASLAPVETTTTSEHAYTVGNHLMLAGQRYIVTADIAVGDTLDVSTNIQAISIEDETGLSQADFAEIITPLPGEALDGVIISPEERRIGWYYNMNGDGTKKPLYQKTIVASPITPSEISINTFGQINNVSTIVSLTGLLKGQAATYTIPMAGENGAWFAYLYYVYDNGEIKCDSKGFANYTPTVTIQYTKSTDTYA